MSGLLHLRLTVPSHLSDEVQDVLAERDTVCNLTHVAGASRSPEGDLIEADVARETASLVVDELREIGLDRAGGIVLSDLVSTPFE